MIRLNRKAMLALEAVLDVAYNARPDPVQAKDITKRQGIPPRYLEQVMQQLVHQGILKGVRGPRGGYVLARERRRITVGEVVRLVEALDAADPDPVSQAELGLAVVEPICADLREAMMARLDALTMEDLCARARSLGVAHGDKPTTDFTI